MSERARKDEYGPAIDRAAQGAGEQMEALFREIDEAAALLGEILARPSAERLGLVQEVRFHGLKVCQLLEARSEEAWCEDAVAGVELARLAVEIAGRLDEERYGQGLGAEMVPIFASRDVHPEALAALALFQKAAAAEQIDRALLDRIARELQRTATSSH
jgi:hypothetical protein